MRLPRALTTILTIATLALPQTNAQASDADGNFALRGYGARTCSTYLTERSDPAHAARYGSWLMGYMTARNRLQSDTFDILPYSDGTVIFQAVGAICADNKDMTVESATNEVIGAIAPLHQRGPSATITLERGGQFVRIRRAAIENLQSSLAQRGLYSGPIDGAWSEAMAVAVEKFQLREGIVANGLPDLATLIRAIVL